MFEQFLPQKENAEEQLANRQLNLQQQQSYLETDANTDQTYIAEQEGKADLLRWQQELDDELLNCVQTLRGYAKNEDGNWIKVREKPLCNDKFIHDVIVPQCKPFLSRNLINSNFEEKRILKMLRYTMDDISDAMCDGWDVYSVNFMDFDLIMRTIKNVIIPAPFRALKGWTKKTDSTMSKRMEAITENPQRQQQKRGFMQSMFDRK
jgi:hypothetical protein